MKKIFLLCMFSCLGMKAQQRTSFVYFDFDRYELNESAKTTLDSISGILLNNEYSISVYGFTDDTGKNGYNAILGQKRADAVSAYFKNKGIHTAVATVDDAALRKQQMLPEKKRRVRIVYQYKTNNLQTNIPTDAYTPETTVVRPSVTGNKGSAVTLSGGIGPGSVSVEEYMDNESMIANNMYAVTTDGQILRTEGMLEICNTYKKIDSTGYYNVTIPARKGFLNTKAIVWLAIKNSEGNTVWQPTEIEIKTDAEKHEYNIRMKAEPADCIKINLDALANRKNGFRVIYVYTDKPYNFSSVSVTNKYQEAVLANKVNDTTWAFTAYRTVNLNRLTFSGVYGENKVELRLRNCIHKTDRQRNHHYYFTEAALKAGLATEIKKKGFFGWWDRVFNRPESIL